MSFRRLTNRLRPEGGFTLIELMISMTVMLALLVAVLDSFDTFSANARENEQRSEAQEKARLATDQLARDLRNMASPGQSSPAIDVAEREEIVFKAVDPVGPNAGLNRANIARVRYCLGEESANGQRALWKQWQTWTTAEPPQAPSASAPCPAATVGTFTGLGSSIGYVGSVKLADSLVNRGGGTHCAFRSSGTCFPNNGLVAESDRFSISALKVKMFVDVKPEPGPPTDLNAPTYVHPNETGLETEVALRNQNRAPSAGFTATVVGTRQIILNGSQSLDPEGAPLQYAWTVSKNGSTPTALPSAPILEYSAEAGVYTFRLKVTDPGGLFQDAPVHTVTVS